MNFLVEESWEIENPVLKAFHPRKTKLYSVMEMTLNWPLWQVRVLVNSTDGGDEYERRFIFASLEHMLAALKANTKYRHEIIFQPAFGTLDRTNYSIHQVEQIIEATDPDGGQTFVLVDAHGARIQFPHAEFAESELREQHTIYDRDDPIWIS
jgi:hypothetical protein